jgi:hypothetical protein
MKYEGIKGIAVARHDGGLPVPDATTLGGSAFTSCVLVNADESCDSMVFMTSQALPTESMSLNYFNAATGASGTTTSLFPTGSFSRFGRFTSIDGQSTLTISSVPEAATWLMLIIGFGVIGTRLRRRRPAVAA